METPEPEPDHSERRRASDIEFALQAEAAGRAKRRRRWIMIAGTLAYLVSPFAAGMLADLFRSEALSLSVVLAVPAGIGGSIAYFGMTMTDHRRDARDWGFAIPSRCFWCGVAPYVLISLVFVFVLPMVALGAFMGWAMTILGSGITCAIIDRWFYKEE